MKQVGHTPYGRNKGASGCSLDVIEDWTDFEREIAFLQAAYHPC